MEEAYVSILNFYWGFGTEIKAIFVSVYKKRIFTSRNLLAGEVPFEHIIHKEDSTLRKSRFIF